MKFDPRGKSSIIKIWNMPAILEKLQIIMKNGKPNAVVLGIKKYERLLEMAEDREDLLELRKIKRGKVSFGKLEDYIARSV